MKSNCRHENQSHRNHYANQIWFGSKSPTLLSCDGDVKNSHLEEKIRAAVNDTVDARKTVRISSKL